MKINSYTLGKIGEAAVASFYESNNYNIIYKNWRWSNKGELDLIAYNKNTNILAICEVKTRKSNAYLSGCYSVNIKKQKQIKLLTTVFIECNPAYKNTLIRFDVADVIADNLKFEVKNINLIENAF